MKFIFSALVLSLFSFTAFAQDNDSVPSARGWPINHEAEEHVGPTLPFWNLDISAASGGDSPEGIKPLERDIFTSTDFYLDRELWTDPRYFRCNSPLGLDGQWGDYSSGPKVIVGDDPNTAAWGHCDKDYPRESMVSPYSFSTAEEHYQALLAEADSRGGPDTPSYEDVLSWEGRYVRNVDLVFRATLQAGEDKTEIPAENHQPPQWILGHVNQMPTVLSLLTDEYQERLVQQLYHQAHGRASQWSLMYCRPEGFMRVWSGPGFGALDLTPTPKRVQLLGGSGNAKRLVYINREFNMEGAVPRLGEDVRRWFGESIGFWDNDNLIVWTSNIQSWFTHASWDHSDYLQTIEIYSKRYDDEDRLVGLEQETIFYDPEVFVEPVRQVRFLPYETNLNEAPPQAYTHCNQTIFPIDGRGEHVSPGTTINYTVPDLYDRPWAEIYENFFEQDMERPEDDIFNF